MINQNHIWAAPRPRHDLLALMFHCRHANSPSKVYFSQIIACHFFGRLYKNHSASLARNSVAVAPAFAHCTNRCTRRKVTVTARSTKQENRKMKKRSQDENTILKNTMATDDWINPHTRIEQESRCIHRRALSTNS